MERVLVVMIGLAIFSAVFCPAIPRKFLYRIKQIKIPVPIIADNEDIVSAFLFMKYLHTPSLNKTC